MTTLSRPSFIGRTDSGHVACVGQWGHGRAPAADFDKMPATIIADDGDGHHTAYQFTGAARDAMALLAPRFVRDGKIVVSDSATRLTVERAPDDFWIERSDEFIANTATYPNVLAY